ncbi:MAG: glycosyltransferase [Candidatus Syntrophopropionicum ammoniitolerans]
MLRRFKHICILILVRDAGNSAHRSQGCRAAGGCYPGKRRAAEMVEDGVDGYLTSPSTEEFAERIISLLNNDEHRSQMGKNAERNAAALDSVNCTTMLLNCYHGLKEAK